MIGKGRINIGGKRKLSVHIDVYTVFVALALLQVRNFSHKFIILESPAIWNRFAFFPIFL